jgi:hypothetical protein
MAGQLAAATRLSLFTHSSTRDSTFRHSVLIQATNDLQFRSFDRSSWVLPGALYYTLTHFSPSCSCHASLVFLTRTSFPSLFTHRQSSKPSLPPHIARAYSANSWTAPISQTIWRSEILANLIFRPTKHLFICILCDGRCRPSPADTAARCRVALLRRRRAPRPITRPHILWTIADTSVLYSHFSHPSPHFFTRRPTVVPSSHSIAQLAVLLSCEQFTERRAGRRDMSGTGVQSVQILYGAFASRQRDMGDTTHSLGQSAISSNLVQRFACCNSCQPHGQG